MADIDHKVLFGRSEIVSEYAGATYIMPPEEAVLARFQNDWRNMTFLDIGVGGGRTTNHFAGLVREYHGMDFSAPMVDACRGNFKHTENISFSVGDARTLTEYATGRYDFVLFSFNGIDTLPYSDREKVLAAVRRVLKAGGHFFFSSHNFYAMFDMFKWKMAVNPRRYLQSAKGTSRIRRMNPGWKHLESKEHALIFDGAHDYQAKVCYVRPEEQVGQVTKYGFKEVDVFSLSTGEILRKDLDYSTIKDPWLYYLCQ